MPTSMNDKLFSEHPAINNLLQRTVQMVRTFSEGQLSHIQELVKIGLALSAEKQLNHLLEMIVSQARRFTKADGGTLYLKREKGDFLDFAIVQNESLALGLGGSQGEIAWPAVPLLAPDGTENHTNVSAHCALIGAAINIPDVYTAEGFDFQGTKKFDTATGYRSQSMLVVPLLDHENEVIGVLQLLNAINPESGEVVSFPAHEIEMITSLASQAAIAVTNIHLIKGLEALLDAVVQTIAVAIDEKSPYTGGHILRVADLTVQVAQEINNQESGPFANIRFTSDQLAELRMAAWMHDVGKITTPENVINKSTKLETIYDRIETVRHRIEILKRDAEIKRLQTALANQGVMAAEWPPAPEIADYEEQLQFLEKINLGGEFLAQDKIAKVKELAAQSFELGGQRVPLLNDDELYNLTITKGTLTGQERAIINNHVTVTIKMLQNMPFPKKFQQVPVIAGMHHEKLDGTGYPRGLKGDLIPLQARILAVTDVFEALTASDRPYRQGKTFSESMRVLNLMVKDNHLDREICDLLIESGIATAYARQVLAPRQQDDFEWNGKKYQLAPAAPPAPPAASASRPAAAL